MFNILKANMAYSKAEGYLGHVQFSVEGHEHPYEITLQSLRGKDDWSYALNFLSESGKEEDIEAVEELLEEDEWFDLLVNAGLQVLEK
ncbi:hypothetical protein P5G65_17080 [Paenibacillus chondroitinus]|uniref:Uncharacterized protein n=1 Tax=Paenibacillus chondroitinus TaxID=59842 RepID=A0ABU6DF73_9BACL|nr:MULTISPECIES: hypothetical protein [Paenibacillus]MCY9662106.1 hypothetical protein [Paenibacillus anseongense]MEB4795618.1 hypothetical protein [Paenibacillus chondroitinus]